MRRFHSIALPIAVVALCFAWISATSAADFEIAASAVQVQFAHGETVLGTVNQGEPLFRNQDSGFSDFPTDIAGWSYTCRNANDPADVTLDVPAGTTLYLMTGIFAGARQTRLSAETDGWSKAPAAHYTSNGNPGTLAVYKKTFSASAHLTLVGSGNAGAVIIGQNLELLSSSGNSAPEDQQPASTTPGQTPQITTNLDVSGSAPLISIGKPQVSIMGLAVIQQPWGEQLGHASRLILTATEGRPAQNDLIPVSFTIPVGHDMQLVLDDVVRAIDVRYRVGGVKKLELSFQDK